MKRISPAERTRIAATVAPTSMFDCFWRLRIKSNYGTVDAYLSSLCPTAITRASTRR